MKKIFLTFLFLLFISLLSFYIWFPSPDKIKGCFKTSLFESDLCPSSKNYVALNAISKYLQNAVIMTEDSSFYQHTGFDQEGIERCYEKFKEKNRIVCGGSTITQQLAKNMFLSKDKTFIRKGVEALITIQIEKSLSKKEILERYLNIVQFGKNIFGVKQAAQVYFKKLPAHLNIVESAFLAMVLPNPEKYSQSYYRQDLTRFARKRLSKIIENSYKYKRISSEEYESAMNTLDSFLKFGKAITLPKDQQAELTKDDLSDMDIEAEMGIESEKTDRPIENNAPNISEDVSLNSKTDEDTREINKENSREIHQNTDGTP